MEFYHNKAINSWYKATTTKLLLVTYFNELELFFTKNNNFNLCESKGSCE